MSRAALAAWTSPVTSSSVWPLRASTNGRYIVNNDDLPFLVFGDSVQSLLRSLSEQDSEAYFANRESWGVNANWVHLYSNWGQSVGWGNPFTSGNELGNDLSEPRETYFEHVDRVLNQAKSHSICLFMGVPGRNGTMTSDGSSALFFQNTAAVANNFGKFLGARYRNQGNIVWVCGNDYRDWNTDNDVKMRAFMDGLISEAPDILLGTSLYPTPKLSWDAPNHRSRLSLNLNYTYAPPYTTVKRGYNQGSGLPLIQFEAVYDEGSRNNNNNRHGYWGTAANLRRIMWWSLLWGANGGYFYGHEDTWKIEHSEITSSVLDTNPFIHSAICAAFMNQYPWYNLIPDFNHEIVTAGYGSFQVGAEWNYDLGQATATTTAALPDGSLAIAYMERGRNTTVAMGQMSGLITAQWFDPRESEYTPIGQFDNSGSHVFVPPSTSDDWVLVLNT